jgi:hypothetical protein
LKQQTWEGSAIFATTFTVHRPERDALALQIWKKSDIGSGEILAAAVESIKIPGHNKTLDMQDGCL